MKLITRCALVILTTLVVAGTTSAQKTRKLPEKAYIESAQISIVSGDTLRYKQAIAMLDSLIMFYGPHPEAYFWLGEMQVDFVKRTPGLAGKEPYVKAMAAYRDSIKFACSSPDVKDKYKKECKDFIPKIDSTVADYWRTFYNNGVAQYQVAQEALKEMNSGDSASAAFYRKKIDANVDSALTNMKLCVVLDSTDPKSFLLAGAVLAQKQDFAGSNEWLDRGVKYAKDEADSGSMMIQIAYNQIQQNKYCEAIPYFQQYLKHQPTDTSTLVNLTICYNNCKMYDSAAALNRRILELDPAQFDALSGLGRYYNQMGLFANDSASAARDQKNDAAAKRWSDTRTAMFDSSKVYFKRAFEADQNNTSAAEEYGIISLLTNDYNAAAEVFSKLTELEPNKSSHWVSLGDSYFYLKDFSKAAGAYEKVVVLEPDNRQIWERLSDLYRELKQPDKAAEAQKHLK